MDGAKASANTVTADPITSIAVAPVELNADVEKAQSLKKVTSQDENGFPSTIKAIGIMSCVYGIMFLGGLDRTIVATATPAITNEFNSLKDVGWYGSAYLIAGTAFVPFIGKIYRQYNPKWVFIITFLFFEENHYDRANTVGRTIPGISLLNISRSPPKPNVQSRRSADRLAPDTFEDLDSQKTSNLSLCTQFIMAWVETQPGYWLRPIGENEAMIKMIGDGGRKFGKDVWSISATASFVAHVQPKPLAQALRNGWKVLRFHHPSIATAASEDTLEYHTPDSTSSSNGQTSLLSEHASVLLNLSHWRTDGIGAFHLLNAYSQAVLTSLPNEILELPVEEALSLPRTSSPDIERAAKQYLDTIKNNIGALETPYKSGTEIAPKGTRGADLRLSQDTTTELETACRGLSISLEAAVHAAVTATAYSAAAPTSRYKHHSSTLRHSFRPHLPPPYDGEAGAARLYTAGYIVAAPASQSWLENARQYEAEYRKGATPDLLRSRRQYAHTIRNLLKNMPPPDPPPSGLDISYVPDVQALVKPVYANAAGCSMEVRDVGMSVEVLSRHLYVFVCVFRGRLALRAVCNEAFYDVAFVEGMLAMVERHLRQNLLPACP
ncbi:hypothetical protein MMC27_000339 [Xylographa pallens]|nr:hypothetical protein [Xylographa pallens]